MTFNLKKNIHRFLFIFWGLMIIFSAACSGGGGSDDGESSPPPTTPPPDQNSAPTAIISGPADATTWTFGAIITFSGSGSDTEDGALSGDALLWASTIDGSIGTGETLALNTLSLGNHTITLTATDSNGATGTATASITINNTNTLPTASITSPSNSSQYNSGTSISFTGSGNDAEDGVLSGTYLVWTSNIDGQIGTGANFTKSDLSVGTHTITLFVTDSDNATNSTALSITINASSSTGTAPAASITSPASGSRFNQGASVSFGGSGTDLEDGTLLGGALIWISSIDGQIGIGTGFITTNLSVGTHTITLTATDSTYSSHTDSVTITINTPPSVSITSPANSSLFDEGTVITFTGSGNDSEDGVLSGASLVWTSSIDGLIGTGASFTKSDLSAGTHTISLIATDSENASTTSSISVSINMLPVITIYSPADGSIYDEGESVSFSGNAQDESGSLPTSSLRWNSDIDGPIGIGTNFNKTDLSVGTHTITLTATDSDNAVTTSSFTVTINTLPTVSITSPTDGVLYHGTTISFSGSANDTEDGALSGTSLVWTSNISGQIATGASGTINFSHTGTHTITLTATDSDGGVSSTSISITVNGTPTASISSPTNDSLYNEGATVSFSGSGSDPEDSWLSGASLVWTSDLDGQIGTDSSFTKADLSVGVHTITLTATDSDGGSGTASISITINATPTVSIICPTDDSLYKAGNIPFSGIGNDLEDGSLSGASLVWTSDIDGQIDTGEAFIRNDLSLGTHTITLTATDSDGASVSDSVTLVVGVRQVGTLDSDTYHSFDIKVSGDYAYMTDMMDSGGTWSYRLLVIDISTPSSPALVGTYNNSGSYQLEKLDLSGDYVYATNGGYGLQVIDVSTPSAPFLHSTYSDVDGFNIAISGNYAHLSQLNSYSIVDISSPPSPSSVVYSGSHLIDNIYISDTYAYGLGGWVIDGGGHHGLFIFDISNPTSPTLISTLEIPGLPSKRPVIKSGNYAYAPNALGGIDIIDISTPSSPYLHQTFIFQSGGGLNDFEVSGEYLYTTMVGQSYSQYYGLEVVDISVPFSPVSVGQHNTPGGASALEVSGNYVYVADTGLQVFYTPYSGLTNASLNGTYIMNEIGIDSTHWTGRIEITFDGDGNGTWQQLDDSNGSTGSGSLTYNVSADGTLSIDGVEVGMLNTDERFFNIVDTNSADSDLSFHFGVKQSSGLSNATLHGTFMIGEMGVLDADHWTRRIEATFDGNGNGIWQYIDDSDGSTDSGSLTYTVEDDGTLSVDGATVGQLSSDGNVFTIIDAEFADNDVSLQIGLKQSSNFSNNSLKGDYIVEEIGVDSTHWTGRVAMTFDGDGNGTWQQFDDSKHATGSGTLTYSVTDSGVLSIDGTEVGQIGMDTNVFMIVDSDVTDSDLSLHIGIKKSIRTPTPTPTPAARCFTLQGTIENRVNSMGPAWDTSTLFASNGLDIGTQVTYQICTDEEGGFTSELRDYPVMGGSMSDCGPEDPSILNSGTYSPGWLAAGTCDEYVQVTFNETPPQSWAEGDSFSMSHSIHQPLDPDLGYGDNWYSRILFTGTVTSIDPFE